MATGRRIFLERERETRVVEVQTVDSFRYVSQGSFQRLSKGILLDRTCSKRVLLQKTSDNVRKCFRRLQSRFPETIFRNAFLLQTNFRNIFFMFSNHAKKLSTLRAQVFLVDFTYPRFLLLLMLCVFCFGVVRAGVPCLWEPDPNESMVSLEISGEIREERT